MNYYKTKPSQIFDANLNNLLLKKNIWSTKPFDLKSTSRVYKSIHDSIFIILSMTDGLKQCFKCLKKFNYFYR